MLVLSIDVGIKNLAHCLFESEPLTIVDWDIVDLSDQPFCACGKKATMTCLENKTYCKKHCPEAETVKKTLEELQTMCRQRNLDADGDRKALVSRLKIKKVRGAMQVPDVVLAKSLLQKYSAQFHGRKIGIVLIENQPAVRLKALQGMLIQYWTMQGALVEIVSPANKLKALNMVGTSYAQRKKLSIEHTRRILTERKMPTTYFDSKKGKKDDLADSFLQGYWYWENKMRMT
jgi:glutaredoxin